MDAANTLALQQTFERRQLPDSLTRAIMRLAACMGTPLDLIRSWSVRSGPCGSSGRTAMSVCMNRIGAATWSVSGGVVAAIGASAARSSSIVVRPSIGPIPDDPTNVMCGGSIAASLGSYSRWTRATRSATGPSMPPMT